MRYFPATTAINSFRLSISIISIHFYSFLSAIKTCQSLVPPLFHNGRIIRTLVSDYLYQLHAEIEKISRYLSSAFSRVEKVVTSYISRVGHFKRYQLFRINLQGWILDLLMEKTSPDFFHDLSATGNWWKSPIKFWPPVVFIKIRKS